MDQNLGQAQSIDEEAIGTKVAASLIIFSGLAVYLNGLNGPLIYDDIPSIVENTHIRSLTPWSDSLTGPPGSGSSGRPLVALSLALNYAVHGLQPFGYHLFNVLVHILTGVTLFCLVRQTCSIVVATRSSNFYSAMQLELYALAVALLWTVHPLATDAVNQVISRNEALMAFFFLQALYLAARGFTTQKRNLFFAGSGVACVLSMCAKEVAVSIPIVVLFYDRTFVSGSILKAAKDHARLYVGLCSSWLLLAFLVGVGDRGDSVGVEAGGIGIANYALTQIGVLPTYLNLALWPSPLVLDYSDWPIANSLSDVIWSASLLLALAISSLWGLVRGRVHGFVGCAVFCVLAPSSSFVPLTGEIAAEHRMYLPLAGLVALAVYALWRLLDLLGRHRLLKDATALKLVSVIVISLTIAFAWMTVERNRVYATTESIWSDTVHKRPKNARAHESLGDHFMARGEPKQAMEMYAKSVALEPNVFRVHFNLGNLLMQVNQMPEALEHFETARRLNPNLPFEYQAYSRQLIQLGRDGEGIQRLFHTVRLWPNWLPGQMELIQVLATTKEPELRDIPRATEMAEALSKLHPDNAAVSELLMTVNAEANRRAK